mmetsp:Transcript_40091/g.94232  ORF Transcript_40091/g.94232 Transcript_40091/m.94232 type:complete len:328 (+) Transcript_40091:206-1189(+)
MYTSRPATHVSDALQPPPLPHVITSRGSVIAVPAVVVCGMLGLLVDDLRAQKVLGRHHARGIARRQHGALQGRRLFAIEVTLGIFRLVHEIHEVRKRPRNVLFLVGRQRSRERRLEEHARFDALDVAQTRRVEQRFDSRLGKAHHSVALFPRARLCQHNDIRHARRRHGPQPVRKLPALPVVCAFLRQHQRPKIHADSAKNFTPRRKHHRSVLPELRHLKLNLVVAAVHRERPWAVDRGGFRRSIVHHTPKRNSVNGDAVAIKASSHRNQVRILVHGVQKLLVRLSCIIFLVRVPTITPNDASLEALQRSGLQRRAKLHSLRAFWAD